MHNEPFSIAHKFTERILQLIEKLGESKQDEEVDKITCEIIRDTPRENYDGVFWKIRVGNGERLLGDRPPEKHEIIPHH